jgi:hypothetical protein
LKQIWVVLRKRWLEIKIFRILNFGFRISERRKAKFKIQNSKFKIQNSKSEIQNPKSEIKK